MMNMKKFIVFIVVMLPITAILSMGAGFMYAGNAQRGRNTPSATSEPLPIIAPPIILATRVEEKLLQRLSNI